MESRSVLKKFGPNLSIITMLLLAFSVKYKFRVSNDLGQLNIGSEEHLCWMEENFPSLDVF